MFQFFKKWRKSVIPITVVQSHVQSHLDHRARGSDVEFSDKFAQIVTNVREATLGREAVLEEGKRLSKAEEKWRKAEEEN